MNLKTTFENQKMASCSLCLFRSPSLPWIAVLVCSLLIIISGFLGFGYYLSILILTSLVLIISTVFLTFSKQNPLLPVEKVEEEETTLLQMDQEVLPKKVHLENETIVQKMEAQRGSMNKIIDDYSVVRSPDELSDSTLPEMEGSLSNLQLENENPAQKKEAAQEGGMHQIHDKCLVISSRSSDSLLESESVLEDSSTSEDSETDWLFQDNVMNQSSVCSDGSISDEESLIEIAIPTGHYVSSSSSSEKDPKLMKKLQKKMPDFMAKSIFQQHSNSLMELLAEINEENLIEIDISMGSIKCSRFEIEA